MNNKELTGEQGGCLHSHKQNAKLNYEQQKAEEF
jgi:hypothetical protein